MVVVDDQGSICTLWGIYTAAITVAGSKYRQNDIPMQGQA